MVKNYNQIPFESHSICRTCNIENRKLTISAEVAPLNHISNYINSKNFKMVIKFHFSFDSFSCDFLSATKLLGAFLVIFYF